jgi:hypothetical protein
VKEYDSIFFFFRDTFTHAHIFTFFINFNILHDIYGAGVILSSTPTSTFTLSSVIRVDFRPWKVENFNFMDTQLF